VVGVRDLFVGRQKRERQGGLGFNKGLSSCPALPQRGAVAQVSGWHKTPVEWRDGNISVDELEMAKASCQDHIKPRMPRRGGRNAAKSITGGRRAADPDLQCTIRSTPATAGVSRCNAAVTLQRAARWAITAACRPRWLPEGSTGTVILTGLSPQQPGRGFATATHRARDGDSGQWRRTQEITRTTHQETRLGETCRVWGPGVGSRTANNTRLRVT